jgi:hypothetical protein
MRPASPWLWLVGLKLTFIKDKVNRTNFHISSFEGFEIALPPAIIATSTFLSISSLCVAGRSLASIS